MIRNAKALSLALVAVFAMSAVVASAANAEKFTSAGYPTTLSGSQLLEKDVFTTNAGKVECNEAKYSGTATEASESVDLTPTYSECKAFGFNATIDVNGCKYRVTLESKISATTWNADIDIICTPTGNRITVTAPGCTVHVPEQTTGTIKVHVIEGRIQASINLAGLTYTVTPGCITTKAGTFNNGTYVGGADVSGSNGNLSID